MYRSIIDSEWVDVEQLTVLVGKNEVGKTSLLKALHKLSPYTPEPYGIESEWPRGRRKERNQNQAVCVAQFKLNDAEALELTELTGIHFREKIIEVSRDYAGKLSSKLPEGTHQKYGGKDLDEILTQLPTPALPVDDAFGEMAKESTSQLVSLIKNVPESASDKLKEPMAVRQSRPRGMRGRFPAQHTLHASHHESSSGTGTDGLRQHQVPLYSVDSLCASQENMARRTSQPQP